MPQDTPISGLAAYSAEHGDDLTVIVDVHDESMAAAGTDKKCTIYQLFGSSPDGSIVTWSGGPTGLPTPKAGLDAGYF